MTPNPATSRWLVELEALLQQLIAEHRKLLGYLEAQQLAMRAMDLGAMDAARNQQEACRLRITGIESKRKLLTVQIGRALKTDASALTLRKLAELHPQRREVLLGFRKDLTQLAAEISRRTRLAGALASGILGHLNTVVRLLAGAVEKAGLYTKSGVPQVSRRIGVMEAVG